MNCEDVIPLTQAYSDGELDLVGSLELERHLASCSACSQAYENIRALKTALKSGDLYFKAPVALRRQIRSSIQGEDPSAKRTPFAWWEVLKLAIPVGAVALLALLLLPVLTGPSADDRLAFEVTSSHVRSLMLDHKTDVASSDQHTVKPWFQGKLDFTPPVIDLAQQGFALVGGRLDYLQGRPVAALVYQRRQHLINLFVWPAVSHSKATQRMTVRQGYNLVHWTASGMTFWAVSDLNLVELREFVKLIR